MIRSPQPLSMEDITSLKGVLNASIITRNGEYLSGSVPVNTRKDTFAAMSAIMLGASERLAIEVNDGLYDVTVNLSDCKLTVIGLDSQYLMTVISTPETEQQEIIVAAQIWKEKIKHLGK